MFSGFLGAPQGEGRSRSKSPGGRTRDRSRSRDNRKPASSSPSDDEDHKSKRKSKRNSTIDAEPPTSPDVSRYETRRPSKKYESESEDDHSKRRPSKRDSQYEEPRSTRSKYDPPSDDDRSYASKNSRTSTRRERRMNDDDDDYAEKKYSNANGARVVAAEPDARSYSYDGRNAQGPPGGFPGNDPRYPPQPQQLQNASRTPSYSHSNDRSKTQSYNPGTQSGQYADVGKMQYAKPDDIRYAYNDHARQPSFSKNYETVDIKPNGTNGTKDKVSMDNRYVARPEASRSSSNEWWNQGGQDESNKARRGSYTRERSRSPNPDSKEAQLRANLGRLSIGAAAGAATLGVHNAMKSAGGGRPPPSPLLESYKGTYQTISPMPSPLSHALPSRNDEDLSDFDLDSDEEDDPRLQRLKELKKEKSKHTGRGSDDFISPRNSAMKVDPKRPSIHQRNSSDTPNARKKVSFYDPEDDAKAIEAALHGTHRKPDVSVLLKILPGLTTDELILLKQEYKKHAKISGQGIQLSKHIKFRIPGNMGKVIYATSLGQYESDAHWANCFYQSSASRRELLIESLVGRSNQQIREIKDVFKDKKYDDDLEKCMRAELKADKFRMAILIALEERRMMEGEKLDLQLVKEDAEDLYEALNSSGGESQMIKIVIVRSDTHLREVLRFYERRFGRNFARDMIDKSRNLVGETLAHVLNGALNRPMRDALLLHQAIAETAPEKGRAELLISRIVRLHWEPKHLERVKEEYERRYKSSVVRDIQREVQANMKTEDGKGWTQFCVELVRSSEY